MKAKITKWCEGERIQLSDVVPLDTPISLLVEPASACNFRCFYCPHSTLEGEQTKYGHLNKIMEYSIFEKLINDAKAFPRKIKAMNLSRFGEPLLNKRLSDMVALAKRTDVCELVKIITNGSMLSPETNLKLINAGLDVLRISVQGISESQIYETCGYKVDFKDFVKNIGHFYKNRGNCKVFIKIIDGIINDNKEEFFNIFGDICDEISIEHLIETKDYIAEEDKGKKDIVNMMGEKRDNVNVCSIPFYAINVGADGNIYPCCADINGKIVLGNVMTDAIVDIWNSKKMNQFRLMQLEEKRYSHPICSTCVTPTYASQSKDNVDSCKEKLFAHYNELLQQAD